MFRNMCVFVAAFFVAGCEPLPTKAEATGEPSAPAEVVDNDGGGEGSGTGDESGGTGLGDASGSGSDTGDDSGSGSGDGGDEGGDDGGTGTDDGGDTGGSDDGGEDAAGDDSGETDPYPWCPSGYTCSEVTAPSFVAPSGTTERNDWLQASCEIYWNPSTGFDETVGTCLDLQFSIHELPDGTSTFSTYPDWSCEIAEVGCDDRVDDCASDFEEPEECFALAGDASSMSFQAPAGDYNAPFSCDIDQACSTPTSAGDIVVPTSIVCRDGLNPTSGANVRWGADFLACRGCDDGYDDFLEAQFDLTWHDLAANECIRFVSP